MIQEELLALWERRRPLVLYITYDIEEALLFEDRLGGTRRASTLSPDRRRCDDREYAMTPSDSCPDTDAETPPYGKSHW